VDSVAFKAVLEGRVPDGPRLGKRGRDGEITHRPGRDVTLSAPKSVSLMSMVGGDERIVEAHDRAVTATLGWIEKNAVHTRMQDPGSGPGAGEPGRCGQERAAGCATRLMRARCRTRQPPIGVTSGRVSMSLAHQRRSAAEQVDQPVSLSCVAVRPLTLGVSSSSI